MPGQRVEPVDRAGQLRERLRAPIASANVRQLVHERGLPIFAGPVAADAGTMITDRKRPATCGLPSSAICRTSTGCRQPESSARRRRPRSPTRAEPVTLDGPSSRSRPSQRRNHSPTADEPTAVEHAQEPGNQIAAGFAASIAGALTATALAVAALDDRQALIVGANGRKDRGEQDDDESSTCQIEMARGRCGFDQDARDQARATARAPRSAAPVRGPSSSFFPGPIDEGRQLGQFVVRQRARVDERGGGLGGRAVEERLDDSTSTRTAWRVRGAPWGGRRIACPCGSWRAWPLSSRIRSSARTEE